MDRHEQEGYQSLLRKQHAARMQELRRERKTERSEEHTSELQSQSNLVCRLLLEKKKKQTLLATAGVLTRVLKTKNDRTSLPRLSTPETALRGYRPVWFDSSSTKLPARLHVVYDS